MSHSVDNTADYLDHERLLQLYGDDTEMMVSAMAMFLDEVIPNFLEMENLINLKDWEGVTDLTHQLRPWLGMVGLTTLENKLWEIEKLARKRSDYEILMNACDAFNKDLEQTVPVLKIELQRIR